MTTLDENGRLETVVVDAKKLFELTDELVRLRAANALLRTVAEAYIAKDEFEPGGECSWYKISIDATEARKAAIDGGAMGGQTAVSEEA